MSNKIGVNCYKFITCSTLSLLNERNQKKSNTPNDYHHLRILSRIKMKTKKNEINGILILFKCI